MPKHIPSSRLSAVLISCILGALACGLPTAAATESAVSLTPTPLTVSATAAEDTAMPAETATLSPIPPSPTATDSPVPPSPTATATDTPTATESPTATASPTATETPTATKSPTATATPITPTSTLDISGWLAVIGTWSGCVGAADPGVPAAATPCAAPSGNFVTLWIKSTCTIGEYCGNYVKARFESEYVRLRLTFLGLQGSVVWMRGVSSSPIYSDNNTDVAIQRMGARVRITEKAGYQYIFDLPRGCDQVIVANTTIGCFQYLS